MVEKTDPNLNISIYGVLSQTIAQTNKMAIKPLEQGNFTVDSQQITPFTIMLRGVLFPDDNSPWSAGYTFDNLSTWLQNKIDTYQGYANNTQLFSLFNKFSFTIYAPIKLLSYSQVTDTDMSLPEFNFVFQQVQTTDSTNYSTSNTAAPSEPQNSAQVSTQG
jgi:hypothetical protein